MAENLSNLPTDMARPGDVSASLIGQTNVSQLGATNFVGSNVLNATGGMSSLPNTVPSGFPMNPAGSGTEFPTNNVAMAQNSMSLGN